MKKILYEIFSVVPCSVSYDAIKEPVYEDEVR